jgi:hypothetical protein
MGAMDNWPCWTFSSAATNSLARKLQRLLAGSSACAARTCCCSTAPPPPAARLPAPVSRRAGCRSLASVCGSPASSAPRLRQLRSMAVLPRLCFRCTTSARGSPAALPRLRLLSHGLCPRLASFATSAPAANAARRPHCRIRARALRPPQQSWPYASFACCSRASPPPAVATVRAATTSVQRALARSPRLEMLRVTRVGDKRRGGSGRRRTTVEEEDARQRGREGEDVRAAGFLYVQRSLPLVQDYPLIFIQ